MKKPKISAKIPKVLRRKRKLSPEESSENVPRITNETVAAHREQVLSSARKYIYPLQHSKHRIVLISTGLFIATIIAFFTYCTLALYKLQSSSTFMYRVTQVVPFPVSRVGSSFVSYESYLFELRHYIHYYETQLKTDFNDPKNQEQLTDFKKKALEKVINDAYIRKLAEENDIKVTDKEINDQITILRSQNRLGGSDKVFEDVLKDFWGWTVDDFKRSLRQELVSEKVVAKLDTATIDRANNVLTQLKAGGDFAALAKQNSEDAITKDNGGEFGFPIDKANKDLSALTTDSLFKLNPGQTSEVINVGYALEILKNIETNGDKIRGAHILFNFKNINDYVNDLKDKQKARAYIKV